MKFISVAATFAATFSLAHASVDLTKFPTCAIPCLDEGVQASGCSLSDTVCQCTTGYKKLYAVVTPCVEKGCSPQDGVKTAKQAVANCAQAAPGSPGAQGVNPTSTSSSSGSTSTSNTSSSNSTSASNTTVASSTPSSSSSSSSSTTTSGAVAGIARIGAGVVVSGAGALAAILLC